MHFGNVCVLFGLLLAFAITLSAVLNAIRGGRRCRPGRRAGTGIAVALVVMLSVIFAAFWLVSPRMMGRTACGLSRQFERRVHAATAPLWRQHARAEHRSLKASQASLDLSARVEHKATPYAPAPLPWLSYTAPVRGSIVWNGLLALALAALLYVGYAFLDAATRGHFTWRLRILSVTAFVVFCAAMAALRAGPIADL